MTEAAVGSRTAAPLDATVTVDAVSFAYPTGHLAVTDITMRVGIGEIVGIVGPSGCGKSTLLSAIAGSIEPTSGTVTRPARGDYSMVFQKDTLLPWLPVEDNILLGFKFMGRSRPPKDYLDELLRLGRLDAVADKYPHELSGGMRRRVAFLTAIAPRPKLMLLDEPFSAIDEPTRIQIHQDVLDLVRGTGTSLVLVTHDLAEAITLCDRVIILSRGPGRLVTERAMNLPADRDVFAIRNTPQYAKIYGELWETLSGEIKKSQEPDHG